LTTTIVARLCRACVLTHSPAEAAAHAATGIAHSFRYDEARTSPCSNTNEMRCALVCASQHTKHSRAPPTDGGSFRRRTEQRCERQLARRWCWSEGMVIPPAQTVQPPSRHFQEVRSWQPFKTASVHTHARTHSSLRFSMSLSPLHSLASLSYAHLKGHARAS
jgi:hypothetical protein